MVEVATDSDDGDGGKLNEHSHIELLRRCKGRLEFSREIDSDSYFEATSLVLHKSNYSI
jgi:hypothetical protein